MKVLRPKFESFYDLSCSYLKNNYNVGFKNPSVGVPKFYSNAYKSFDSKNNKKIRKKGFKREKRLETSYNYIYNDYGDVCRETADGPLFICDNENSWLHKEKSDVRISTRRQRFSKPPEICTDFFYEFNEIFKGINTADGEAKDFKLDEHVVVDGCFDTNKHTLQEQMDCKNFLEGNVPNKDHYNLMKTAVADTIRKLKVEEFKSVDITDIRDFDFDLSTKPGYRYEHYLLKEKKKDCVDEAVYLANLQLEF